MAVVKQLQTEADTAKTILIQGGRVIKKDLADINGAMVPSGTKYANEFFSVTSTCVKAAYQTEQ